MTGAERNQSDVSWTSVFLLLLRLILLVLFSPLPLSAFVGQSDDIAGVGPHVLQSRTVGFDRPPDGGRKAEYAAASPLSELTRHAREAGGR